MHGDTVKEVDKSNLDRSTKGLANLRLIDPRISLAFE